MIVGNMDYWRKSREMQRFSSAMRFLERVSRENLPDGKYEIEGALVFAIVSSYRSRPLTECRFESHMKYLDIQFILSGREEIWVTDTAKLTVKDPYVSDKDLCFYEHEERAHRLDMSAGDFAVLFPEDGHMPGVTAATGPEDVRKVVVKIDISAV